jgi:hypothetical protein
MIELKSAYEFGNAKQLELFEEVCPTCGKAWTAPQYLDQQRVDKDKDYVR